MGSNERTILRIRCSEDLFRRFKKVAADFKDYEEALEQIMDVYQGKSLRDLVRYSKTER